MPGGSAEGLMAGVCPAAAEPRRIDHLVKMNLPPLMGRRDAAYDRVAELLNLDLFAADQERRLEFYEVSAELMRRAGADTRSLLVMISSRDTAVRERNMLGYLTMVENSVKVLQSFIELENRAIRNDNPNLHEFIESDSRVELVRNEQMLTETEITLVNQLRAILERSGPKLMRYRGYAIKNFSRENAERYNNAYRTYSEVYAAGIRELESAPAT